MAQPRLLAFAILPHTGFLPPSPPAEKATARQNDPNIMHHPDALPQRDPRRWPARHGYPVSRLCHLEVVRARDVFNNAVARVVPNVHAKGENIRDNSQPSARSAPAASLVSRRLVRARLLLDRCPAGPARSQP